MVKIRFWYCLAHKGNGVFRFESIDTPGICDKCGALADIKSRSMFHDSANIIEEEGEATCEEVSQV